MNRFDDLLTCVRILKDNHTTLDSLRNKSRDELKVSIELNAAITVDDTLIDSIIKVFEIFEQ